MRASVKYCRELGRFWTASWSSTICFLVLAVSTRGVSPVTVIVSSTAPTFMSALTVAVNVPVSSTPSRLTVLKPVSANVTVYAPGLKSWIRNCPVPSVTAVRVFSMSTGLEASTVTPGSTAPEASFT